MALSRHSLCVPAFSGGNPDSFTRVEAHVGPINECDMIDWFQFLGDNVLDVPSGADVGCSDEEQDVLEVNTLVTATQGCSDEEQVVPEQLPAPPWPPFGFSDEEQDVPEVNALATAEDDSDCEEQCADKDTSLVENNWASDASFHVNKCTPAEGYHALDDKPASSREHEVCSGGQHKTFVKRHCKAVKQALNKWIRCFPAPYVCHGEKKRIADILHISFEQVTTFCNNYRKRFAMVNKKNVSYTTTHRISSH